MLLEIVGRDPVCGADFCGEWRCFGKLSQEEGVSAGLSDDKTPMALTRIRDVAAEKSKAWDFLGMDPCGGGDFGLETAQYCKITEKEVKRHEEDFAEVAAVSAERKPNGGGMGSFSRWLQTVANRVWHEEDGCRRVVPQ